MFPGRPRARPDEPHAPTQAPGLALAPACDPASPQQPVSQEKVSAIPMEIHTTALRPSRQASHGRNLPPRPPSAHRLRARCRPEPARNAPRTNPPQGLPAPEAKLPPARGRRAPRVPLIRRLPRPRRRRRRLALRARPRRAPPQRAPAHRRAPRRHPRRAPPPSSTHPPETALRAPETAYFELSGGFRPSVPTQTTTSTGATTRSTAGRSGRSSRLRGPCGPTRPAQPRRGGGGGRFAGGYSRALLEGLLLPFPSLLMRRPQEGRGCGDEHWGRRGGAAGQQELRKRGYALARRTRSRTPCRRGSPPPRRTRRRAAERRAGARTSQKQTVSPPVSTSTSLHLLTQPI